MVRWTAPIALSLAACAEMPSTGQPFTPVAVDAAPIGLPGAPAAPGAPAVDPAFEVETFSMSSDDLHAAALSGKTDSDVPKPAAPVATPAAAPAPEAPVVAEAVPAAAPAPAVAPAPPAAAAVAPVVAITPAPSPWPVRLVMTLPQSQPPRAILGLPGGKEIVVSPGSMVPEEGLVVMSIGRDRVQLARIQGQGDHAAVAELSLSTQY